MKKKCTHELSIREATRDDVPILIAFNQAMALETEHKHLSVELLSKGVRKVVENPEYGIYFIAEKNTEVCGSLMITKEWSDWRNGFFWWIQSVFIKPEFRRQRIYGTLYEWVKTLAKNQSNICGFRLYAEKGNDQAHTTYSALGMKETSYVMFEELL